MLVSTAIDESILEIALAKAGLAALLLSTNNSAAAVAHLIKLTKAAHLIYGPRFEETSLEAQRILAEQNIVVTLVPETRFPLWGDDDVDVASIKPFNAVYTPQQERSRPAVILHSSGSVWKLFSSRLSV